MEREPEKKVRTKNAAEIDATEHRGALYWKAGDAAAIKAGMNRRHRRETREILKDYRR